VGKLHNIIEINGLSSYGTNKKLLLSHIDLTVKAGECVVVAGANGSGKSTLLKHLNGLMHADKGEVIVDGLAVDSDPRRARKKVGMIFQDTESQIVGETVFDDVAFGPENLGMRPGEVKKVVSSSLQSVGLSEMEDLPTHILSGGEKRRLSIAGILAMSPSVILFDEPFSNLDYPGIKQVLACMHTLKKSDHTMLIATHNLEVVVGLADRLVLMQHGEIVREGPFSELLHGVENFGVRMPEAARLGLEVRPWLIL